MAFDPFAVEAQKDGAGGFGGVGNVQHGGRVQGIAAVGAGKVVEIDDVEFGRNRVPVFVFQEVVVSDEGEVIELEIVHKHGKTFFDVLPDDVVDDKVRFAGARRTQYQEPPKGVDDVDPAFAPFTLVVVFCGQVDGVFVFEEPFFLGEGFIFAVENVVVVQALVDDSGEQGAAGQDEEVAQGQTAGIEYGYRRYG